MSSFYDYGEYGNVGWIDSRYSACLEEVFRSVLFELLPAFVSDGGAFVIVKPFGYNGVFFAFQTCHLLFFLDYVRLIVTHNLNFIFDVLFRKPYFRVN